MRREMKVRNVEREKVDQFGEKEVLVVVSFVIRMNGCERK